MAADQADPASLKDREQIRDLIYLYCRAIDRGDLDILRSIVHDDARFEYGIFSGSALDFADYAEQFVSAIGPTSHNVTNILLSIDGDSAHGESYCIAYHGDVAVEGTEGLVDLIVNVRYLDRFERREGVWKIAHRTVVYDWNQNIPKTAQWTGPLHGLYAPRGQRGAADALYGLWPDAFPGLKRSRNSVNKEKPMKLYYLPGACSLASHIALREAGLPFDLIRVKIGAERTTEDGADYWTINPKGAVPALALDDGTLLTENAVVLQYIAEQGKGGTLMPEKGMDHIRALEWLNYIATDIHKGFSPLFNPMLGDDGKAVLREGLKSKLAFLAGHLDGNDYIAGGRFSVVDLYAFTVLNWAGLQKIDLAEWPSLGRFVARIAARPHVQAALKAEGLA